MRWSFLGALISVLAGVAQPQGSSPVPHVSAAISHVSGAAIMSSIESLQAFGTRHASFTNRHAIAEWIHQSFLNAGVSDVAIDSFQYNGGWQKNVVATVPGSVPGLGEVIIGAHYDSQSNIPSVAPGADDNASGTAGIIEIARVLTLAGYAPRATIRYVAFAAEELGLVGSSDYADKVLIAGRKILLMQNYDMIGYRSPAHDDWNVNINVADNARPEAILDSLVMRTYTPLMPILTTSNISRSDSWPFVIRQMKAFFVIEHDDDFNPRYHSPRDSSVYVDSSYAAAIVRSAVAFTMLYDASVTSAPAVGSSLPAGYALHNNVPNPFNPSTSITFEVPVRSHVTLEIIDLLGRTVAVLAQGEMTGGVHTRIWRPDGAAGTYICRLRASPADGDPLVVERVHRIVYVK